MILIVLGMLATAYLVMKKEQYFKHYFVGLVIAQVIAHFGEQLFFITGNLSYYLYCFNEGAFYVLVPYCFLMYLILPLFGKWRPFKDYFVMKGEIAHTSRTSYTEITGTVHANPFGGHSVDVQHHTSNHDTLMVRDKQGEITTFSGFERAEHGRPGDVVIVAGQNPLRDFLLINRTQNDAHGVLVTSRVMTILRGLFYSIPGVGQFFLSIYTFQNVYGPMKALVATRSFEFEFQHKVLVCLYQIYIPYCLYFQLGWDVSDVVGYLMFAAVITQLHFNIMRKDYLRFDAFLTKEAEALT